MFEHWRQITYFDNEESVFPSEELLDELELYDTAPRRHVAHAFSRLVNDFNTLLLETGIYDWFYSNCYERVSVNDEAVLFS